jgi:plasmid stability protein
VVQPLLRARCPPTPDHTEKESHIYGKIANMARIKTTLSLDEHLLRQIRVRAARSGRRDSEVMEAVLREGLGALERIRTRTQLGEDDADALASSVVHEVRREKPGLQRPPNPR